VRSPTFWPTATRPRGAAAGHVERLRAVPLGIPVNPERAAQLFTSGKIATIDLGLLRAPGQPPRHFVHAATVGLNVNFAKLATRASVREHFGRFTYVVAAALALRERPSFSCELHYDGKREELTLTQLSVINAPTFGGALGMRLGGLEPGRPPAGRGGGRGRASRSRRARCDGADHAPALGARRRAGNSRPKPARAHRPSTGGPLDGELAGTLPGDFEVVAKRCG